MSKVTELLQQKNILKGNQYEEEVNSDAWKKMQKEIDDLDQQIKEARAEARKESPPLIDTSPEGIESGISSVGQGISNLASSFGEGWNKYVTNRGRLDSEPAKKAKDDKKEEKPDLGLVGDAVKLPEKKKTEPRGFGPDNIPLRPEVTVPAVEETEPAEDLGKYPAAYDRPTDSAQDEPAGAPKPETPEKKPLTTQERISQLNDEWVGREQEFDKVGQSLDKEFAQAVKEIKGMYSAMQNDVDKQRMWEQLINGLGHIAAGVVGLQTGLNLGGLKFDKRDWDKEKDRLMREMNSAKEDVYRNLNTQQRTLANKRAQAYRNYQMKRDDIQQAFQNAATVRSLDLKAKDQKIQWIKAMTSSASKGDKALEKIADKLNAELINELDKEDPNYDKVSAYVKAANARAGKQIFGEPYEVARTIFGVDTGFTREPKGPEMVGQVLTPENATPSANQTQPTMPPAKPGYTLKKDKQGNYWYVDDKDPTKGIPAK